MPHRKVFIVGHMPRWVRKVTHIPGNLAYGVSKWRHGWNNVLAAAWYDGDMTDEVVMMNDDFFILDRTEDLPLYWRSTLENHVAGLDLTSEWGTSMYQTWDYLLARTPEPLSYDLHVPMAVSRDRLREVMSEADLEQGWPDPPLQWRTLYGNLAGRPEEHVQMGDVKIKDGSRKTVAEFGRFVSLSDRMYRRPRIASALRVLVPAESPYL